MKCYFSIESRYNRPTNKLTKYIFWIDKFPTIFLDSSYFRKISFSQKVDFFKQKIAHTGWIGLSIGSQNAYSEPTIYRQFFCLTRFLKICRSRFRALFFLIGLFLLSLLYTDNFPTYFICKGQFTDNILASKKFTFSTFGKNCMNHQFLFIYFLCIEYIYCWPSLFRIDTGNFIQRCEWWMHIHSQTRGDLVMARVFYLLGP